MSWEILIAHAEGEENLAEELAAPIREEGYKVTHRGTIMVGESITEEASRLLSSGGPVVLCATVKAIGTGWATRLVNAARSNNPEVRIFPVQMEKDAYIQHLSLDGAFARYWQDPAKAIQDLTASLKKYFPVYKDKSAPVEMAEKPLPVTRTYDLSNPVFFVPFDQKGDQVIGREKDLEKVRRQLTGGKRTGLGQAVALEGFGGLGKTQLAVEYAYGFKDNYPNGVIWVNADQDIESQLIEVVDEAGWIAPESEHKDKLAVAKQRLRAHPNCLVVFDNVESLDAIETYLQLLHNTTHILATTRFELFGFEPIPIDPLDEDLSYQLLIQESRREPVDDTEKKIAFEIVRKLDGHPLAIELAGAYLRQRPTVGLEQYQRLLASSLKDALPKKFLQNAFTKHKADLYSTLKINESLFDDEPRLKDILDLLAWSGSASMGEDLLCRLLNIEAATRLTGALGLGTTLRILHKPQNTESYSIHRLVREVRREDVPLQGKEAWITAICIAISEWFKEKRNEFSDLSEYEAEIDHLKAWEQNAILFAPQYASRLIWLQAYPSFHQGRYSETLNLLNKASELYEELNLQDLDLKAHLLNDSGTIISALGDSYIALNKQEESLRIRQELYGEKNEDVAASLNNIGNLLGKLGNYQEELKYAQKALELRKELLGEKHPDVAMSFNDVGLAFGHLGNYQEELKYAQKALELRKELRGEKHPNVATSLNDVGLAFGHLGNYQEELKYTQKALELRRELLGEKHPNVVTSLSHVGLAFGHLGNYQEELKYAQKALELCRELLGENHLDVATALNNIGGAFGHLGNYQEELEYFQKGLELRRELLGENHPEVATTLNNVGLAFYHLGNYQEDINYGKKSLNLYIDLLGKLHPYTLEATLRLANTYLQIDDRDAAFQLINPLLSHLPQNSSFYPTVKKINQFILSKTVRPGFRQPPVNANKRKKKGKKK